MYRIHDKHYDLSNFIEIHPGGRYMFNNLEPYSNITPLLYSYHTNINDVFEILSKYETTSCCSVKYDTNYSYDKYIELKKLVYDEIHEKKIPLYWSMGEITYNTILLVGYIGIWTYCFYNSTEISCLWMIILGFYTIGFVVLVFHETSHYCGFKNQSLNLMITQIVPFVNNKHWQFHHNYLHHCFTNTIYDCDLYPNKVYRYTNDVEYNWYHKYQYLYTYILFLIVGMFSSHVYISAKQTNKVVLFILIYYFKYKILLFFSVCGFLFASVANLSHINAECLNTVIVKKNDFLYNQVTSSMNYNTDCSVFRFICFGLDIQIEHHLFPNIPHSSLRQIKHIVRDYCSKNDIPYIEQPSIYQSIRSYIKHLYTIGNNQCNS